MSEVVPRIIAEIGLGPSNRLGLGPAYPFRSGDVFLRFDLRNAAGDTIDVPVNPGYPQDGYEQIGAEQVYLSSNTLNAALSHARQMGNRIQIDDLEEAAQNFDDMERYFQMRGVPTASIYADGRHLPLATNSAREVVLSNVVSDPGSPEQARMQLLDEALRVVDSQLGRVVTTDFYTPDVSDALYAAYVRPDITVRGYSPRSYEWPLLSRQYATGSDGAIHILSHKA